MDRFPSHCAHAFVELVHSREALWNALASPVELPLAARSGRREPPHSPSRESVAARRLHDNDDTATGEDTDGELYTAGVMDVHPPHEPIHTFKDFLLHILTITIGLLIALGLEAAVEHVHQHHLLHTAEINLRQELANNRSVLSKDRAQIASSEKALTNNLKLLRALKAHQSSDIVPDFGWYWSDMGNAGWNTARDTGAIALMSYDQAQGYSVVYSQQTYVNAAASMYIRDIYASSAPAQEGRSLRDLSPEELDRVVAATEHALADLRLLDDLSRSLETLYKDAGHEL